MLNVVSYISKVSLVAHLDFSPHYDCVSFETGQKVVVHETQLLETGKLQYREPLIGNSLQVFTEMEANGGKELPSLEAAR